MDLADIIEETRLLKRRLCMGSLELPPNRVFKEPFIDMGHFLELKGTLEDIISKGEADHTSEAAECLEQLGRIVDALSGQLARPPNDDLCRRFTQGLLDARTVMDITGWSADELYDECKACGLALPAVTSQTPD